MNIHYKRNLAVWLTQYIMNSPTMAVFTPERLLSSWGRFPASAFPFWYRRLGQVRKGQSLDNTERWWSCALMSTMDNCSSHMRKGPHQRSWICWQVMKASRRKAFPSYHLSSVLPPKKHCLHVSLSWGLAGVGALAYLNWTQSLSGWQLRFTITRGDFVMIRRGEYL